jgi:hypothetical protein
MTLGNPNQSYSDSKQVRAEAKNLHHFYEETGFFPHNSTPSGPTYEKARSPGQERREFASDLEERQGCRQEARGGTPQSSGNFKGLIVSFHECALMDL